MIHHKRLTRMDHLKQLEGNQLAEYLWEYFADADSYAC